ncbi:hypothetical protein GN242_06590 [Erwinia sorbitola]|uniref:Uncharacterized protein n=1 Tax=Erwinia sorbitola TaxID=2681984 RepID=A0A6I6EKT3_9GAMM|nr:hypothetical protein GN242_06590 [Erwinia sorbitola]
MFSDNSNNPAAFAGRSPGGLQFTLTPAGLSPDALAVAFSLFHLHPAREFCVQYQKPDFSFIQRLTAEEGIFYYFEFDGGKNTLVYADDFAVLPGGGLLPYNPNPRGYAIIKSHRSARLTGWRQQCCYDQRVNNAEFW